MGRPRDVVMLFADVSTGASIEVRASSLVDVAASLAVHVLSGASLPRDLRAYVPAGRRGDRAIAWAARRLGESRRGPVAMSGFTPRESTVFDHLGAGLSNKEIGARMCIVERTVKFHVSNVLAKLGVRTRGQAARAWLGSRPPSGAERAPA